VAGPCLCPVVASWGPWTLELFQAKSRALKSPLLLCKTRIYKRACKKSTRNKQNATAGHVVTPLSPSICLNPHSCEHEMVPLINIVLSHLKTTLLLPCTNLVIAVDYDPRDYQGQSFFTSFLLTCLYPFKDIHVSSNLNLKKQWRRDKIFAACKAYNNLLCTFKDIEQSQGPAIQNSSALSGPSCNPSTSNFMKPGNT